MNRLIQNLLPAERVYRYERKFHITQLSAHEIEGLLRHHPEVFSEIYEARMVNNIYLDSFDQRSYFDNVAGYNQRYKVRVRWYGELRGDVKPFLEIKIKENYCGFKLRYALKGFCVDENLSQRSLQDLFKESDLPLSVKEVVRDMKFSLLNRYRRKYFLSDDKRFRITTDTHLEYYKLSPHRNDYLNTSLDNASTVVELKYDAGADPDAESILRHLPFRLSRMSKYISGLDRLAV